LAVPVRAMAAQATLGVPLRLLQLSSAAASATIPRHPLARSHFFFGPLVQNGLFEPFIY
jgi:hypothetical protein